jgi:RNA polymerase sigma-70 factor (ECF subfamily)
MHPLGDVYERHYEAVRRFARHLSGNASQADDLTQEAFVRLWTTSTPIRTATVRAYLFAIVRHEYLRSLRRSSRFAVTCDLPDVATPADERAEHGEDLRRVRAALTALDETDRALVLMRSDGELSYSDIGQALRMSAGAARVRVHRARRRLLDAFRAGSADRPRPQSKAGAL